MTEDEIIGWHHRLNGHEFDQAPGVGDGQGSLACCSPWGHKESDMTEKLTLSLFTSFVKWILLSLLLQTLLSYLIDSCVFFFLLQGIFPTQGSNPGLPHRRQTL